MLRSSTSGWVAPMVPSSAGWTTDASPPGPQRIRWNPQVPSALHLRIQRRERMSWSSRFGVWMPYAQYFWRGYAMHAYPIVPAYPASHGCVRVPSQEAEAVWNFGRLRMRVWIGVWPWFAAAGRGTIPDVSGRRRRIR